MIHKTGCFLLYVVLIKILLIEDRLFNPLVVKNRVKPLCFVRIVNILNVNLNFVALDKNVVETVPNGLHGVKVFSHQVYLVVNLGEVNKNVEVHVRELRVVVGGKRTCEGDIIIFGIANFE